jgi:hypothetical protein
MELLTTCTICYNKYSHPSNIPLVLTCGHTFCNECVCRFSKCPHCRQPITSTIINLIIFSLNSTPASQCLHDKRKLFCPTCGIPLCISCVSIHNTHGIIPITDPNLSSSISDKLSSALIKLKKYNEKLRIDIEKIIEMKQVVSCKEGKIRDKVKDVFELIVKLINTRKQEICEELDEYFRPISSKIDVLIKETQRAIQENIDEMKIIEGIKRENIEKQIAMIRPFQVRSINQNWITKVMERAMSVPRFELYPKPLIEQIQRLGQFSLEPSRSLFGISF